MTILGFDPGLVRTGYAVVATDSRLSLSGCGVIAPPSRQPLSERFAAIFFAAQKILQDYRPDVVAIEEVYFARNAQSTLKVGIVRGLLMAAALEQKIEVVSFAPAEVKIAVSGKGNATKTQVQYLSAAIFGLRETLPPDSADALALCVCYLNHHRYQTILNKKRL